jgi:hypothetical protein
VSEPFEYSVLRAVPRVERGEFVNVAVVLYCQARDFLSCTTGFDTARLRALHPGTDLEAVQAALAGICAVCEGSPAAGAPATGSRRERFGWLTAPRSTVVQAGPVHSGVTDDPAADLARLARKLVS